MFTDLQKQNQALRKKIFELQIQISSIIKQNSQTKAVLNQQFPLKQLNQTTQKTQTTQIDYSPINTCQSLQEDIIGVEIKQKSLQQQKKNENQVQIPEKKIFIQQKQLGNVRFEIEESINQISNLANSQVSKQLELQYLYTKKSSKENIDSVCQQNRNIYSSAIKEKNICQGCIQKMHQMNEMEFLKNKYHKQYVAVRTQLQKIKADRIENQNHTTLRSSINLYEICGEHNNQEKSQKSSFSFQNIQNTLLSERFTLEIQQVIKLIDRLVLLEKKFIQFSPADIKLVYQLQFKIERLKAHLGLDTELNYIEDLFHQIQKSEQSIKKIHQKYKKLVEKIVKVHKQKIKKNKYQFNQVCQKFVKLLKNFCLMKEKNQSLLIQLTSIKQIQTIKSMHQITDNKNSKQTLIIQNLNTKESNQSSLSGLEKSSKSNKNESKSQKQFQKCQLKIKNLQKVIKKLQKTIKQLNQQILFIKKKSQVQLSKFIDLIIISKNSKIRNFIQQTECSQEHQIQNIPQNIRQNQIEIKLKTNDQNEKSTDPTPNDLSIEQIGGLVYEIFSFTSCQSDEDENVFLPQSKEQIIEMLNHIKKFAQKFDQWQKYNQRQINGFQKNFLQLLKFFISNYRISQESLLQEIMKMKDNQSLVIYIKKYYEKSKQLSEDLQRVSSTFTFGQKSQSCKDSQNQI